MFSPDAGCAVGTGKRNRKGQQHPEAVAVRLMAGGNYVDAGETLARADCEANLAYEGKSSGAHTGPWSLSSQTFVRRMRSYLNWQKSFPSQKPVKWGWGWG
jgi:hypothetical protein